MKVNLSLSKRTDLHNRCEILLLIRRRDGGKVIDIRAKSGIFIDPKMFDPKKKIVKTFSANKLQTDEVIYHNAQLKKLDEIIGRINDAYNNESNKNIVCGKWLDNIVHPNNHADEICKDTNVKESNKDIYGLFDEFLAKKQCSEFFNRGMKVCIRSVARYEMYIRETDQKRKDFAFDVETVTRKDIEGYQEYIRNEKNLSEKHPRLFKKILSSYPANVKKGNNKIEDRGGNSVYKLMKKLKSFFLWLNREGITSNRPFDGVEMGSEKYGTPYYISSKERDIIADAHMPTKELEAQRDIFIFHCLTGCRVGDLVKFTSDNISNGMLVYTPHKTKNEGQQALQARVPLHEKATKLIEKYKGADKKGERLFPFISPQKYNDAIKKIFTIAGITRMVEVRNALTGEMENRPINEIASSHLARRTFVGNLYSKVSDPNLIGKMSGHVDGSRAFARYRKIEDETLKNVIDML